MVTRFHLIKINNVGWSYYFLLIQILLLEMYLRLLWRLYSTVVFEPGNLLHISDAAFMSPPGNSELGSC